MTGENMFQAKKSGENILQVKSSEFGRN